MIEIKQLNVEHIHQIVLFDKTCFPTDFWKEEDWKELLEDPRAIYYALLDRDKIVGDAGWYMSFKALTYEILFFLILLMLFSTIVKMTFVAKYNGLVKKKK